MATEVKLPELGEGIEDVTISRWRVKEGDAVKTGDVIVEVATDKVDTEVNAPADGQVLKINFREGEIAPLNAALAVIGAAGEQVSANGDAAKEPDQSRSAKAETMPMGEEAPAAEKRPAPEEAAGPPAARSSSEGASSEEYAPSENGQDVKISPVAKRLAAEKGITLNRVSGTGPGGQITKEDVLTYANGGGAAPAPSTAPEKRAAPPSDGADVISPDVQRAAAQYNVNLTDIAQGRPLSTLTRYDVLRAAGVPFQEEITAPPQPAVQPAPAPTAASVVAPAAPTPEAMPAPAKSAAPATPAPAAATQLRPGEELVKHSRMRVAVARNTAQSIFTAPHVTTMWDVDMSTVIAHRKTHKKEFEKMGVNLTITAYLVGATIAGLKTVPAANATWTEEGVIIKRYFNIGMATALPMDEYGMGGLIVPVIKNAGDLNLTGLARAVNDLAEKARKNQLRGEDLQEGTFTISNYGTSGSRFQTPVIVQPQVGILGTGVIEKRPVVVSNGSPLEPNAGDYLTFKPMLTLGFSYDHRVLDGATADAFCAAVKGALENWK
ncbi:MAG: dihydrolipoamide acetyltransferase family protein [Caldilineaceae bacterium]